MRFAASIAGILACMTVAVPSQAQSVAADIFGDRSINTGDPRQAYFGFCESLPSVLASAYFQGYACTASKGTGDNINRVLKHPKSLGFAQLDALLYRATKEPELLNKLTLIRDDIACEGLWMITTNQALDFGSILGLARRISWVLPPEASGSVSSFRYLQSIDPEGLGRATNPNNITFASNTIDMINTVATDPNRPVGFFVQFADPRNEAIAKITENPNMRIIPVISRDVMRAKINGSPIYKVQNYGIGPKGGITTACTPAVLFTGGASNFTDRNDIDDNTDMVAKLKRVPVEQLLPKDSMFASIFKKISTLSDSAVTALIAGVEKARASIKE